MTEQVFFDTDCLSAFLWVERENLIVLLYRNRIVLPQQVYDEISRISHLKMRVDRLISNSLATKVSITTNSQEERLYRDLISASPNTGLRPIGRGEASALTLAKFNNGILGSNNMRDIVAYVRLYNLKHITTGDILIQALEAGGITEGQGNGIWKDMLSRQRMLPTDTFTNFLKMKAQYLR
jgi:predicted nucleic acid-binding protein